MTDSTSTTTETPEVDLEPRADLIGQSPNETPETNDGNDLAEASGTPVLDDPQTAEEALTDTRLAKVRNEAKGLRERLRATETEAQALREQIGAMRQAEVVRAATEHGMADGLDLFRTDGDPLDLDSLYGDDGALDRERLLKTVNATLEKHPHWQRQQARPGRKQPLTNLRSGASDTDIGQGPRPMTWQDALQGRRS
ncbi:hypothetical protein FB554_1356 [Barrientosiimonas humi]|uniref:Minor structural protein GP20 n=1 Tax=Barrientosiimonas humi TaxID=999931 RepID=A0A542XBK6_9MICO|nr:hypothetical protein [Barrientosiimonas humi]TQL33218.1 hypothetical protein FB554_1356 [Barrientosiimonas humi]CAG7573207.1 hypothetical protein BH39T_PBIAJDOK_01834 [Barrientosiimonas humi]